MDTSQPTATFVIRAEVGDFVQYPCFLTLFKR